MIAVVAVPVLVGMVAGVVSALKPQHRPSSASSAAATARPATAATPGTPAVAASSGLIGFAATDAAFAAHHLPDTTFAPGSAYDPDPSLPSAGGHVGARYVGTQHTGGRVLGYTRVLGDVPITLANHMVMDDFPADTRVLWSVVKDTCRQTEYASATLGRVLGPAGDPDGDVFAELDTTLPNGNGVYEPNDVSEAMVSLGAGSADRNIAC